MNETEPYSRQVFYYETDRMGIMHHSNYIRIFEEAHFDLMAKCGADYAEIEKLGIIMPVLEVSCKYLKSLFYEERFYVETDLIFFDGIKMGFSYKIYSENSKDPVTTGESWHCFLNEKTRVPVSLKKKAPEYFEKLKSIVKETQTL